MNNTKLAILAIAAVLSAAAAIWVNQMGQSVQTSNLTNSPLIGGLDIEAVALIQVVGEKGANKVTLRRSEGRFVVVEKEGYPASNARVNDLINACVDMRTAELRSDDPAFHEDLGVTEQKAKFKITFADSQDKPIVSMLISNPPVESKQEVFARLESDNKTYLVLESPYIQTRPLDYIDGLLTQIETAKISQVTLADPNGASYTLKAGEGDMVALLDMPAGKQLKGSDYRQVFGSLSSLRLDDVVAMSDAHKDLKFSKYICTLKDSTVYTLELAKKDGKNFMKMTAEFTDKTPVTIEKGGSESEEVLKAKEAKLLASDAASAFAKKHAGWLYILPDSKFTELTKAKADLLEDIPPAKPADPNQPAAKPV